MNTSLKSLTVVSALLLQAPVYAASDKDTFNSNRASLHLGYQHGEMKDFGALDGANLKLQYETDYPIGIMGSVSILKNGWGKNPFKNEKNKAVEKEHLNRGVEYYSAAIGPTFRFNDSVSLYALTGIAHTKVKLPSQLTPPSVDSVTASNKFAYGFGMIANVTNNLSMTLGYEGSKAVFDEKAHTINSMLVSVGYRF